MVLGEDKRWPLKEGNVSDSVMFTPFVRHDILHWLDVPERVTFKLCMTVYKCLQGMGRIYLSEMCRPSSPEAGSRHLRSAKRGQLVVPRYRLTTAGRRHSPAPDRLRGTVFPNI